MEQTKVTQGRIQGITNREEALQVINQACQCRDEDQEWKKKCQELFPDVTTVTTSKKVRDMTNKALMMVDGEAGATQHTDQLSDVTLPLMDKVNILLDDNKSEELEEVKPDNRENQNDHANFKVTKDCEFLFFHCLQNQNLLPDAFTMPVSEMWLAWWEWVDDPGASLTQVEQHAVGGVEGESWVPAAEHHHACRQLLYLCFI
ncbi:hypothetical protein Pmani_011164 [Petrolisthes manimaculis]|uniref:Uncharacterized protein n=1 Tax=Petrolisthes manimaculis TaxID=1843537 RepID=A0AAE1UEP4_9EUCA|nr:hypothetical protein Pmani_011164 [Petrolisthes manimaculis]